MARVSACSTDCWAGQQTWFAERRRSPLATSAMLPGMFFILAEQQFALRTHTYRSVIPAERHLVAAGRYPMRTAEGGKKVVERRLIRDVECRELDIRSDLVPVEDIVDSDADIEQIPRCNTRRIVVGIERSRSRNRQARGPIVARTGCDGVAQTRVLASKIEADRCLLTGSQADCIRHIRYAAGNLTAVKSPGESRPGSVLLVLVTDVRGLLECLVVIDAKDLRLEGRVEEQTADFGSKESSARVSDCRVRLETVNRRCRDAGRESVYF